MDAHHSGRDPTETRAFLKVRFGVFSSAKLEDQG